VIEPIQRLLISKTLEGSSYVLCYGVNALIWESEMPAEVARRLGYDVDDTTMFVEAFLRHNEYYTYTRFNLIRDDRRVFALGYHAMQGLNLLVACSQLHPRRPPWQKLELEGTFGLETPPPCSR